MPDLPAGRQARSGIAKLNITLNSFQVLKFKLKMLKQVKQKQKRGIK